MTDRVSHLIVSLAEDTREDDALELAKAISRFRGIVGVSSGDPVDGAELTMRSRLRHEITDKILEMMYK